jgi:hypothetical protein
MLAYRNLALTKRVGQPAGNDRHNPLMVAYVRLVHAWHGRVADFVGNDAEQVAFQRLRVKVNDTSAEIRHAFAKFVAGRALNLDRPPFAIELETQRRTPFARL